MGDLALWQEEKGSKRQQAHRNLCLGIISMKRLKFIDGLPGGQEILSVPPLERIHTLNRITLHIPIIHCDPYH